MVELGAVARLVACPLPQHILLRKTNLNNNFPLPLIQEELIVSYLGKNGHLILVNWLRQEHWLGN